MTEAKQKQVLLVEKEDSIAASIDRVIRTEGHACARLRDGDGRIGVPHPDLILVDTAAADGEGLEFCRRLRRDPGMANVKILMLHGSGSAIDRRRGAGLGADGFVSMPFAISELRTEVRRLLDGD